MRPHLDGYDPATLSWRWRHPQPAVDALAKGIAALVASDTDAGVRPAATHAHIREVAADAAAAAGIEWTPAAVPTAPAHGPRLSEPWFCCAEPTARQFSTIR